MDPPVNKICVGMVPWPVVATEPKRFTVKSDVTVPELVPVVALEAGVELAGFGGELARTK